MGTKRTGRAPCPTRPGSTTRRNLMACGAALLLGIPGAPLAQSHPLGDTARIEAVGMVIANRSVAVEARLEARVTQITADLGDSVAAGVPLVVLESRDFDLSLETALAERSEAKAELKAADADLDRKRSLFEKGQVPRATLDETHRIWAVCQARATKSEIAVRRARDILARTEIRAPFAGFVETKNVEIGQIVHPGDVLFKLVDIDVVRVRISVIERDIARLAPGMSAMVSVDVFPEDVFLAEVTRLSVVPDPAEGTYPVELELANRKHLLKPGFTARVTLNGE